MSIQLEERRLQDDHREDMKAAARDAVTVTRYDAVEQAFKLALEINKGGKYWCFVNLFPHVNLLSMHVNPSPEYSAGELVRLEFYYDGDLAKGAEIARALVILRDIAEGRDETRHFAAQAAEAGAGA